MSAASTPSTPTISNSSDVVDYLKAQHQTLRQLFTDTLDAPDADSQEKAFNQLRALLAVHETAEEMMVHPRVRRKVDGGSAIVDERLHEEHDSKIALAEIEKLEFGTAEFSKALIRLQQDVLAHAEKEETEEFIRLQDELDADERAQMTLAVQAAERIAPTHPHPGVESAVANFAAGPFASLIDRARDALSRS
ncbi:hemerythrin domain-containing protein [Mycolicibacterium tokaiense]|uniref:Hemerythrin HHE cation binding domain-containing protein n=1 Tax=Mycolicibacterium tokaiense TaxID=39695 RepID=A0A378TAX0_9MYCO|nr:hemerythrin domain-containing protein [Mycolicibacterium tokaiense]BBY88475.1 hemerythrin [Mycolicibacterium tokaiense]STZ57003.1 hemerythrin HHE cation binding domain-containing protein [Mycolicibacterium tokaiense]